jgi:hypothetical protein
MGLDIQVARAGSSKILPEQPAFSFENDGYYWFLHPLFETLAKETGQYLDLYDDCLFAGSDLEALARTFAAARTLIERQPSSWRVSIGRQLAPVPKEIHSTVEKKTFLQAIDRLEDIVRIAISTGNVVVSTGD